MQEGSTTRWHAIGDVEWVGWLEAWGTGLIDAIEALQAPATQRVAEASEVTEDPDEVS